MLGLPHQHLTKAAPRYHIAIQFHAADSALYEVKSGDKGGWQLSAVFHHPS